FSFPPGGHSTCSARLPNPTTGRSSAHRCSAQSRSICIARCATTNHPNEIKLLALGVLMLNRKSALFLAAASLFSAPAAAQSPAPAPAPAPAPPPATPPPDPTPPTLGAT